jgi:nucleoside-diphosphate-sugar epimerase
MNVLVTGGTGMLGRAFVQKYFRQYTLSFTGRNSDAGRAIAQETGARFLPIDLAEKEKLAIACRGMNGIVHCAALSSLWGKEEEFRRVNFEGTKNLLEAAEKSGVDRFVHISTPSIYFDFCDGFKIKEIAPLPKIFCNHYAASKALAERLIVERLKRCIILRPRGIFGPHDSSIVPRVLKAVRNGTLWLPSGRNPVIDMTYVENVADAIHLSLNTSVESNEVFNITNGEPTHIFDILQQLFTATSQQIKLRSLPYGCISPFIRFQETVRRAFPNITEPRLTRYSSAMFHYHQTLDISKAEKTLGYAPRISLSEGIKCYGKWYKSQNI